MHPAVAAATGQIGGGRNPAQPRIPLSLLRASPSSRRAPLPDNALYGGRSMHERRRRLPLFAILLAAAHGRTGDVFLCSRFCWQRLWQRPPPLHRRSLSFSDLLSR
ncbi:uncharacterized protein DS421_1g20780 [Arachis hypogaea]|nr:uncharacterized protein DS421_1g20780 [Arachis hypogaea]